MAGCDGLSIAQAATLSMAKRRIKQRMYSAGKLPKVPASLDPENWPTFRRQAHQMLDDMLVYLENIREFPVWQAIPDEVRARFREALPMQPAPLLEVHREFMTSILPYTARNGHPGFLGWVQGGGTPVGVLAEMLAAGLNANLGGRDQIPLEVEHQVVQWVRELFHFPSTASGLFVTGTSMANFLAILVARNARLGREVRRCGLRNSTTKVTAYASVAVHESVIRAIDFAGLGSDALRVIPVDTQQRMDLAALRQAIAADRAAGFSPFLVVGAAGAVDTGAIDDLAAIAELSAEQHLWFHVDGAFGALAMLSQKLAPRLKGIERADSLAFDFHKWAQVPYDAGFLLVRDGVRHQDSFTSSCAYLSRGQRGMSAGSPWPCDLGLDLSRGFRALKTWVTFKVYGTDAIAAAIERTCELARYLERRILFSPELELVAAVELNIVCFRFRSCEETANELNREIVIRLQEAGAIAPSTTNLRGKLVIRAAIVNHRTSEAELDKLVEATLAEGRALHPSRAPWQPWSERETKIRLLDVKLEEMPQKDEEVVLRVERAALLVRMGRNLEARSEHLRVFKLDPANRSNLSGLGELLITMGSLKAAEMVYSNAVRHYPEDPALQVNLGSVLLRLEHTLAARSCYETALALDPEFPQAHGGMYYALTRLGDLENARLHQKKAFGRNNLFRTPYHGDSPPVPLLLLVSSTGGNTPLEKLIDARTFQTYVVVADFYDAERPLPEHHLVVNGIGDADVAMEALVASEKLVAGISAPVLNSPAAVKVTGRCENARRLGRLQGVRVPTMAVFPYQTLAGAQAHDALANRGLTFPLLLRIPGFHMGKHFVRAESPVEFAAAVAALPGAENPRAEILAIEYLDARGADGLWRKFRVMMIGGQLYPLHLAISRDWKIHYFSADMRDCAEHRAEEANFLADMPGWLGPTAMEALERMVEVLGLDYGGFDFGVGQHGEILLFEANATMMVELPDDDPRWDYRRRAVERIHTAVRNLLLTTASAFTTQLAAG
jgi:aromatic-L-amino-acid/L-tryptophan decarboxylase